MIQQQKLFLSMYEMCICSDGALKGILIIDATFQRDFQRDLIETLDALDVS